MTEIINLNTSNHVEANDGTFVPADRLEEYNELLEELDDEENGLDDTEEEIDYYGRGENRYMDSADVNHDKWIDQALMDNYEDRTDLGDE